MDRRNKKQQQRKEKKKKEGESPPSKWGVSPVEERRGEKERELCIVLSAICMCEFLILLSGNRQIPGLATGAVGHSLFYSRR